MYEETFGTDWTTIEDREDAVRRAFALGVAARLGERHPGELDRISAEVDSSYDRSFVELAYHEGREKASDHEAAETDEEERVWTDLVEGTTEFAAQLPERPEFDDPETTRPDMLEHVEPDTMPDDSREAVERPKFLTREDAEEPDRRERRSRRSRSSDDGDEKRGREPTDEERETFQELLDPSDGDDGDS